MMILYNKEAAKILLKAHSGLLRSHSAADQEKLNAYLAIHEDLKFLAFESAKYCPVAEDKTHSTLGYYAHASSPLRRYADIINQRVIKATLNEVNMISTSPEIANQLNRLQKNQKHHDRDYFFLQKMLESNVGELDGIVLATKSQVIQVYVPEWKRKVKVLKMNEESLAPAQHIRLAYYADIRKPHWETKMVFSIM
jgi:exoribonuclease R